MEKNKIRSYLAYAGGEILLVVLGILIALQINNWNEERKMLRNEFFILSEISNNLQRDGEQVQEILDQRTKTQDAIISMSTYLSSPERINRDTFAYDLAQLLTFERYFPIRTSYEVAKVSGLQLSNKKLRSDIANYYEYEQHKLQRSLQDIENSFLNRFPSIKREQYYIEEYGKHVALRDHTDADFLQSIEEVLSYFIPNHTGSLAKLQQFQRANQQLKRAVTEELSRFE